jgi:subtilisin family serine protease
VPKSADDLAIGDPIPGEHIVTLRNGVSAVAFASAQSDGGASILGTVSSAMNGFAARLDKAQLSALASDPNVLLIEENTVVGIEADQANPPSWGLDRIDQRSRTLDRNYSYNFTGSGVNAYIIDTGVRSDHRDFGGRVVAGRTQVSDGRGTEDCNGHGTHVAGTVGGQTYGVAKAVSIIPIRVLSCNGRGSMFNVISGVNWMIEHHAAGVPAVANLSLGGSRNSSMNLAVANAVRDGITVVVAAGNNNRDASTFSPASEPLAITVGAVSSLDSRSSFSNFGSLLDIFAPGQIITSAYHRSSTDVRGLSGTSMAAPHVAGAAALLLEENPNLTPAQVMSDLAAYATPDVVTDPRPGSPNLLLFTRSRWMAPSPEAPSAPQNLIVVPGVAQAALSWTAPTQNGSSAITDYVIEFSANGGTTWSTFADGVSTSTTATVSGLTNGVTYSFRVSAVSSAGTSPASDIARAAVGVPSVPTGLAATAGAAQVALRWTTPSQNGGSSIADYVIEFRADGVEAWSTFADGVSTETSATVTGLANGTTHSFRVSAVNAIGQGGVSSTVTAVPWQVYVPSAPRDLVITSVMATSISLEWRIPAVDGGGFITGYVVEQSGDGGTTWFNSVVTGTGGRAGGIWFTTVYDLTSGREYRFRVRATNSTGNSEPSVVTAARAPGVPSEPEDVRAVEAGPRRVMLRWERPLSDGGVSLTGYTIDYSTDNGVSWTTWSQNTGVVGCTCQYMARTVTDLTDGVAHIFRVKAYNTVGVSQPSESTDPMTPLTPQPPTQPLGLTGTATPAIVELDWEEPANDNGAPISDYVVEYSTDSGSTWTTFSDGVNTATLASLRGLAAGVAHVFRVSAVNSAGRGAPSATSSAITPLAPLVNDAFSGATPIICGSECPTGTSVRVTSSTRSATRETGEPLHGGYGASASLWYSFSIGRAGTVVIDTMGSDFDTLLGVYTGSAVNALTTITTSDDAGGGNWSRVEFSPVVGTTYFAAIDGYGGRKGSTVLNWRFTEAPPTIKPGAPRSVRAVEGDSNATVYWSAPESDGGGAITAYNVTASPGGRTCATTGALTCVVTSLSNGTAYTFTVTATNSAGTGNASTPSDAVTPRSSSSGGVVPLTWGLDRIDQRSLPLDSRYSRTQSGAGVTVYIVDTGVRTSHSELTGRVRFHHDY